MKKILIKASGDTLNDSKFIKFVKKKAESNKIVVICGGGTQISEALVKAGFKIKYNHLGRVIGTRKEKKIIKNVLEREKNNLQKLINNKKVEIVTPVLKAGSIECHINADNLVKAYYLGFDNAYVFTLKDRITGKQEIFKNYPKVKILGI